MTLIEQHPDQVPMRPLRRWALIAVVVIGISIAATIGLLRGRIRDELLVATRRPDQIEAVPFQRASEGELLRELATTRLARYGWIDQATGTIHVPLDIAIDDYLGAPR